MEKGDEELILETKLILDPRVHIGTLEACLQIALALQQTRVELARLGMVASDQVRVDVALALPRLKVGQLREGRGCAHPFDGFIVGDNINVLVAEQFVQETGQNVKVALVLEPNGVEVEAKGSSVGAIVTIEVVLQHRIDFLVRKMCWTRIHHGTDVSLFAK